LQKQLAYSREDERQADHLGFRYMEESRFNPEGMITVLKRLERLSPAGTDAAPAYLLTHPAGWKSQEQKIWVRSVPWGHSVWNIT